MNRRDLLKRIGISLPVLISTHAIALPSFEQHSPDDFMFHGWRVKWRDWVVAYNQDVRIGLWAAYSSNHRDWHLVSVWPGTCGPMAEGQVLNTMLLSDQVMPTYQTSLGDLEWMKKERLQRLKRLIVEVGPPPMSDSQRIRMIGY